MQVKTNSKNWRINSIHDAISDALKDSKNIEIKYYYANNEHFLEMLKYQDKIIEKGYKKKYAKKIEKYKKKIVKEYDEKQNLDKRGCGLGCLSMPYASRIKHALRRPRLE